MGKRVLIAEDYTDIRRMMKIMLELYGYEALEASDGYEAVEKTAQFHPDMILMDISMPVLDGLSATKAIRQFADSRDIPILAVTAYGDFYAKKAIDAGCTAVIPKPLHFDELKPLLDHYLN
jgi:two-component system cell cycle response regulator/two-component system cell cycle response regulator DivK